MKIAGAFRVLSGLMLTAIVLPSIALAQEPALNTRALQERAGVRFSIEPAMPILNDFAMGPGKFRLSLAPGEEQTVELQITSRTEGLNFFQFETEDFAAGDGEEAQNTTLFGAAAGPYPARSWINAAVPSLELSHGERAFVPVTVRVPLDAEPGDHYAALLLKRALRPGETTEKGFNIISRVGVLFLITVEGPAVKESRLLSLTSRSKLYWFYPALLDLRAQNTGTVYAVPTGTVKIRNILGLTVDELPVTDWTVLRNSTRIFTMEWHPRFALGRYTAETNIDIFGATTDTLHTSFWIIPALPVFIALLVIFAVSFVVQYFFSRFEVRKKQP